jgi:hypothetical protein
MAEQVTPNNTGVTSYETTPDPVIWPEQTLTTSELQGRLYPEPTVVSEPVVPKNYGAGWAGVDQAQGLGWRFVQMMGDLWDIESWEKRGELGAEENMALAAAYERQALQESEGMGDVAKWVHDTVKTQIPMMAPSILAAGTAGVLAAFLGAPAGIATVATLAAAYVPNYILNAGETYAKQLEAKGNIDAGAAALTGAFVALLDTIVPGKIGKGLADKITGKNSLSSHIAKRLGDGSKVGNQFKRAFMIGGWEAGTEGTQEAIMQMSRDWVNDKSYGFTEQDKYEIIEGIAAGWLMGGFVGGVTPAGTQKARDIVAADNERKDAIEARVGELQEEINALKGQKKTGVTRAKIRELQSKIADVKKAKTIEEIDSLFDDTTEELSPQAELDQINARLTDAQKELDAAKKAPRGRAPNRAKVRLQEEVDTLTARKEEIESTMDLEVYDPKAAKVDADKTLDATTPVKEETVVYIDLTKSNLKPGQIYDAIPEVNLGDQGPSMEVLPGESIEDARIRIFGKDTEKEAAFKALGDLYGSDVVINEDGIPTIEISLKGPPSDPSIGPPKDKFSTILDERVSSQEAVVANARARVLNEQLTGSRFSQRRQRKALERELAEERATLERLKTIQASPEKTTWTDVSETTPGQRDFRTILDEGVETGPTPTAEQIERRIYERDRAASERKYEGDLVAYEEAALREASEKNKLENLARERAEAEDAAAVARAELDALIDSTLARDSATAARRDPTDTDLISTIAPENINAEIEATEQLLAQTEVLIATMTRSGITTDRANPKPYTVPELQEQLRLSASYEKKLMELRQQAETNNEPLISVAELGPSSLTVGNVSIKDSIDAKEKSIQAWNERRRAGNLSKDQIGIEEARASELENRAEIKRIREDRQRGILDSERTSVDKLNAERKAALEEERKVKLEEEKAQIDFENRETDNTIAEAEASASETLLEFDSRPLTIPEMKKLARVRANKIGDADRIGSSKAKKAYLDIVNPGINEIDSARVEASTRKEKGTPTTTDKDTTTKKPILFTDLKDVTDEEPITPNMSKEEFDYHNRIRNGVLSQERVDTIAQKRIDGKKLNKYEEEAGTWPDQANRIADSEGRIREGTVDEKPTVTDAVTVEEDTDEGRVYEAGVATVISSPRDAIDAVIDGSLEPEVAITELAEAMNVDEAAAEAAFTDEMTTADAQAMVKAGEERGVVAAGTTDAVITEATKTEKLKGAVGDAVTKARTKPSDRKKTTQTTDAVVDKVVKRTTTYKGFRKNKAGTAWTAKIAGSPAKIAIDDVGEYRATYDGVTNPTPFTSLEAAKIHLLEEYGTPNERKKIPGRKVEPDTTTDTTDTKKTGRKPQKYSSETLNKNDVPVQVLYNPTEDQELPFIKMVDGEAISRHKTRAAAMYGLANITKEKAKQTREIWEARKKKAADRKRSGQARVEDAIAKGMEAKGEQTQTGTLFSPNKIVLAGMPIPRAGDSKRINNPNVKVDSKLEGDLVREATNIDGNTVTVSYQERDTKTRDATRKQTSFKESEISIGRFNTFTPFMVSTKEEAQALSKSIYSNPEDFRVFLANEISPRMKPSAVSMGTIDDAEALKMQQSYQRRVNKLLREETANKRLTAEDKANIERWRKKILDLKDDEGRNYKSTVIPGETQADFDESLTRWVDLLEDRGVDVTSFKENLSLYTKKKVDETLEVQVEEYDKSPEFIYHVTPTAAVDIIKEEGITPSIERGLAEYSPGVNKFVHVSDNIEDARSFADHLNSGIGKAGFEWAEGQAGAVSIIKLRNDGAQLFIDPNKGAGREGVNWLVRRESISSDDIVSTEKYTPTEDEGQTTEAVEETGDISDDEFDKLFGWSTADEETKLELLYRKERNERKETKSDKVSVDYILNNENPAELYSKLSDPPSKGGYSVAEVRSLAANIKAVNPDFKYNPKENKKQITASIMEWQTKPMADAYSKDDLFETTENDDIVESRRRKSVTTFHSPSHSERVLRSQFRGIFGTKGVARLEEIGFINFINSSLAKEMGASEKAQAFVSRGTGSIYFISDKISSDMGSNEMRGLIFHEMGVHFGRDMFSGKEWNTVLDEVYKLSKSGDDVVNAAVARVLKNYNYENVHTGRPTNTAFGEDSPLVQKRKEFWEEVLAHVVEMKQPVLDAPHRKGLAKKILNAFKTFFSKVFNSVGIKGETPNVTLDDVVNLIGYSTWHSGMSALSRHGDSKAMSKLRNRKRADFIEGSMMQEPVYHGTNLDWSSPILERTELGLHVGTSLAAIAKTKLRHIKGDFDSLGPGLTASLDEGDLEVIDAWEPGWETKISNRDISNAMIKWDPALRMKSPAKESLALEMGMLSESGDLEANFTNFVKGATVKQGYIDIQDPFFMSDIGDFSDPTMWMSEANKVLSGDSLVVSNDDKYLLDIWSAISDISTKNARERSAIREEDWDASKLSDLNRKFQDDIISLLRNEGYDSIEYINDAEDVGSTSWILLNDNQFKSIDDLSFDSGTSIFSTKKAIAQSNSSEIAESRRISKVASEEVAVSRIGESKARSFIRSIQKSIEPLMAVEGYDQLEIQRMLTKGEVGKWANTGRIIFDILNEASPTEKKAIYKYFTTRNADPSKLPSRKVSFATEKTVVRGTRPGASSVTERESIRTKAVETKELIANIGNDLVKTGLITKEQYDEWKHQYLPKVYMEHVMGGKDRIGLGGLRTSSLTYTKHRKDHDNFLNDVISGRIDDPGFLASRYVTMAGSDMAIIKYLDFIASDPGNNKWVLPGQIMTFRGMTGTTDYFKNLANDIDYRARAGEKVDPERSKKMRELALKMNTEADKITPDLRGVDLNKYRKVPDSPRYGAMRGLYVQKDIWNDINGLGVTGNPAWGELLKWSGRVQTTFKYTKVPMNVPTQARNVISNTILMNVSGTNFFQLPIVISKAMHDVASNGKYMQLARKYGLETTTFAATELGRIDRELAKVKSSAKSFEGMWARSKVFFTDYLDVGGRAYQKTEVLFKVAKMIDLMENHNKTEAEAAKLANEALLDYGNVSQGVRLLRTLPLGSPFITFNAKVMAQMARNIKQHPVASLKYVALPYLFAEMFLSQNDDLDEDDWDALMEFLPDYMETEFSTMVFPYKNEHGKWQALDVSFFLPWGAHLHLGKNIAKKEWGEAVYKNIGLFGGPFVAPIAIQVNVDPFTGQSIWNDLDPPRQRYEDMMMFMASYMVPPMFMPRNRAGAISHGGGPLIKTMMAADFIEGNVGDDGLPRYTMPNALLSWAGISVQQLGRHNVSRSLYFKQNELNKINSRFTQLMRDPGISMEKREQLRLEYREHILKIYEENRKWGENISKIERLF